MNELTKAKVPALPSTVADLLAQRKIMAKPTLNDHVDAVHIKLWPDPEYQALLEAVYDEDAVEGSLSADNVLAAMQIRDYAIANGIQEISARKLATIVKSLNVVLRRYGISRRERKNMIAGEIVPGDEA